MGNVWRSGLVKWIILRKWHEIALTTGAFSASELVWLWSLRGLFLWLFAVRLFFW